MWFRYLGVKLRTTSNDNLHLLFRKACWTLSSKVDGTVQGSNHEVFTNFVKISLKSQKKEKKFWAFLKLLSNMKLQSIFKKSALFCDCSLLTVSIVVTYEISNKTRFSGKFEFSTPVCQSEILFHPENKVFLQNACCIASYLVWSFRTVQLRKISQTITKIVKNRRILVL